MVFAKVQISDESFRQADQFMANLPLELRIGVFDKALRAAAVPVIERARQLAPDSTKSGSRKKWSKKTAASRASTAPHRRSIGTSSLRSYGETTAIFVGPLYPTGNLINVIGHEHQQVLWGRKTGKTIPANKYLQEAAEQTLSQQQAAFVEKVRTESEKILAGGKP